MQKAFLTDTGLDWDHDTYVVVTRWKNQTGKPVVINETHLFQNARDAADQIWGFDGCDILKVVRFNVVEGTSRDASDEIARLLVEDARDGHRTMPDNLFDFCAEHDSDAGHASGIEEGQFVYANGEAA